MSDDQIIKSIENEPELFKVNKIISGKERAGGGFAERRKEPGQNEAGPEQAVESKPDRAAGGPEDNRLKAPGPVAPIGTSAVEQASIKRIENILAEGLGEIYVNMPVAKQREFKSAGEKTASEINKLLQEAKIKINKIVVLIMKWLSMIPGVNRFFLEQEAKIKADEIIKMKTSA